VWYYARSFCPRCGAAAPSTLPSSGRGTVYAATVVHRPPSSEPGAEAAYAILLVDAAEGFRLMARGAPDLAIGEEVRAVEEAAVPTFTRSSE
jgi:uncharacterized OB-fold protein